MLWACWISCCVGVCVWWESEKDSMENTVESEGIETWKLTLSMSSWLTAEFTAPSLWAWQQHSQCPHLYMPKPMEKVSECILPLCWKLTLPLLASIRDEHSLSQKPLVFRSHRIQHRVAIYKMPQIFFFKSSVTDLDSVNFLLCFFLSRWLAMCLISQLSPVSCFFFCISPPCFYQALWVCPPALLTLAEGQMAWMRWLVWFWSDLRQKEPKTRPILLSHLVELRGFQTPRLVGWFCTIQGHVPFCLCGPLSLFPIWLFLFLGVFLSLASVCPHHVLHLPLSLSPPLIIFPFSFSKNSGKGTVPGPESFFWLSYTIDKWPWSIGVLRILNGHS